MGFTSGVFNTVEFEFSHGRKPRGTGYWAFSTSRNARPGTDDIFWFQGSYKAAKAAAAAHFRAAAGAAAVIIIWTLP